MLDDELRLNQIRDAFLRAVEEWHASHDFDTDFQVLAVQNGVTVLSGHSNQAATNQEGRYIVVDERVAPQRTRFSGLHELAHHLFEAAEDGYLRARLKDIFHHAPDAAVAYEEALCDEAAALLLMPTHVLRDAVTLHGHSPLTVLALRESCSASVQAAMRRVLWHRNVPSFGVLLSQTGVVLDSVSHGHSKAYPVGRDFRLEDHHPLRAGAFSTDHLEEFVAPVPFRNGNRNWTMAVRACHDDVGRAVAFFNRAQDITRIDHQQPSLF